jgi:uncharacterized protein (TIGR04255 family)
VGVIPVQLGNLPLLAAPPNPQPKMNGWSFARIVDGQLVEELGIRDMRFGYFTTKYDRWAPVRDRFWQLMRQPLQQALIAGEVDNIRLEYWDRFNFDGEPTEARIDTLLENAALLFPPETINGLSLWHYNRGWFSDAPENKFLVNLNIDANDIALPSGEIVRSAGFYNFVEYRPQGIDLDVEAATSVMQKMHNLSKIVFGKAVTADIQTLVGLTLGDDANG